MTGDVPIKYGSIQNPYKEFTVTVGAGQTSEPIAYNYNYFRLLTAGATGIQAKFGDSGQFTDVIGAGIGFKLDQPVQRIQFLNETGGDITITFALAIGLIDDARLSVSGDIAVINGTISPLETNDAAVLAMLQNQESATLGMIDLEGYTHVEVEAATTTIISSGANTGGFMLGHWAFATNGNFGGYLRVDTGKYLFHDEGNGEKSSLISSAPMKFESGVALTGYSEGADSLLNVWYKLL